MHPILQACLQAPVSLALAVALWVGVGSPALAQSTGQTAVQSVGQFEVHFTSQTFGPLVEALENRSGRDTGEKGFTGQLFLAFSKQGEPRQAMHAWFDPPPLLRFDLQGIEHNQVLRLSLQEANAMHPLDFGEADPTTWKVQAIARVSRTGREPGRSEGDVYSQVQEVRLDPAGEGVVTLHLDNLVLDPVFEETERVKEFVQRSKLLSKFHGFPYNLKAGVILPKDYDPKETYPVVYSVTGFGGTHFGAHRWLQRLAPDSPLQRCILVIPDANNRYGHSVFCDSRVNGPWGQALVAELIPALEKKFGGAGPTQRFVTGVSSGGWSSLWLQVTYPDQFAGCWSHVPDPIDFHDFQRINLYEPLPDGTPRNMFTDEQGNPRPLARRKDMVRLTYEDFVRRETVLNPGGQIRSFEATFSPRLDDGTPRRLFDLETGAIDHETAQAWRHYDISHTLLTRWDELRPQLAGKIHIYAGEVDTFYLEGAVQRFQKLAAAKGLLEDMHVEVVPGMAHSLSPEGFRSMEAAVEAALAVGAGD